VELLFFLTALLAEITGTIVGFGSSTILLPLAVLFFDFKTAITLVAFSHIFGNLGRVGFFRHGLEKEILVKFGLPSVVASLLGALLISYISQEILKAALGAFLIAYSTISFWREGFSVRADSINTVIGGSLSGFLAGLIGTGGALRGAFLTAFGLPKERYIATAAAVGLAVDLTRLPIYLRQGFLEERFYWFLPILLVLALAGSYIGRRVVQEIPQRRFRQFVLVALFLIGIKFIYDWLV
jgi:hypothetical protein